MTANQATKARMKKLSQEMGISHPAVCAQDVDVTVDDIVRFCGALQIDVPDFFNDPLFRNLD